MARPVHLLLGGIALGLASLTAQAADALPEAQWPFTAEPRATLDEPLRLLTAVASVARGSFALLLLASSGSAVGITVALAALTLSSPAAVPDMGMLA